MDVNVDMDEEDKDVVAGGVIKPRPSAYLLEQLMKEGLKAKARCHLRVYEK